MGYLHIPPQAVLPASELDMSQHEGQLQGEEIRLLMCVAQLFVCQKFQKRLKLDRQAQKTSQIYEHSQIFQYLPLNNRQGRQTGNYNTQALNITTKRLI